MTISERALELVVSAGSLGLGSGRAAQAFVRALAAEHLARPRPLRCVATSEETAILAKQLGLPLVDLAAAGVLDATVDGADEVDPKLDLIKGYGRALVREKIVAASSRKLIILVGKEKVVARLGQRGKLPIEVVPFARSLCEHRISTLGLTPVLYVKNGKPYLTDNGNYILDCALVPPTDPRQLEEQLRDIPGVVGTGFFLGMAHTVLIGHASSFELEDERQRSAS